MEIEADKIPPPFWRRGKNRGKNREKNLDKKMV
jgi:hypothetical protein